MRRHPNVDPRSASSAQIYSESALDATLQSGQLGAASAFITQVVEPKLPYIKLPDAISLPGYDPARCGELIATVPGPSAGPKLEPVP